MHVYVFIGRGWWGFTHDETAANLPSDHGPWSFFRNAVIATESASDTQDATVYNDVILRGFSLLRFAG